MTRVPHQTVRDFEALPEGTLAQLIDGEIVMSPSPTYQLQRVIGHLFRVIDEWTQHGACGDVVLSPMDVYLGERDAFQPDLILITPERRHIIRDPIHGAPDLVVEVLSPSTGYYDLTK
jgi:Uma2 family endonuclease